MDEKGETVADIGETVRKPVICAERELLGVDLHAANFNWQEDTIKKVEKHPKQFSVWAVKHRSHHTQFRWQNQKTRKNDSKIWSESKHGLSCCSILPHELKQFRKTTKSSV